MNNDPVADVLRRFMEGDSIEQIVAVYKIDPMWVEGILRLAIRPRRQVVQGWRKQ